MLAWLGPWCVEVDYQEGRGWERRGELIEFGVIRDGSNLHRIGGCHGGLSVWWGEYGRNADWCRNIDIDVLDLVTMYVNSSELRLFPD